MSVLVFRLWLQCGHCTERRGSGAHSDDCAESDRSRDADRRVTIDGLQADWDGLKQFPGRIFLALLAERLDSAKQANAQPRIDDDQSMAELYRRDRQGATTSEWN